jgi:hypothetical protein
MKEKGRKEREKKDKKEEKRKRKKDERKRTCVGSAGARNFDYR